MAAICLTSLITMAFVFIGQVNVLAPIVTINFMLTYIAVDYSYFSISLSYDVQQRPGKILVENTKPPHSSQPLICVCKIWKEVHPLMQCEYTTVF